MRDLIQVEGIYKKFRLGTVSRSMLWVDIKRWWERRRTKALRSLSEAKHQRHDRLEGDEFWALRDVSFSASAGQTLGIMGRNGAGKSTLLKILSRTTGPTLGEVRTKGRMSSLLEVGTGFHPELTGRENIFVNGAILGMSRREVRQKFDEIVEFSEIGNFLDTPVKRYSSGMYVRLAFSVAAHLHSDIMILDEVLAVGDAKFQKKCQEKLKSAVTQGRTTLFVSHNTQAVRSFCDRVIVLEDGQVTFDGETNAGIDHYLASFRMSADTRLGKRLLRSSGAARFDKIECYRASDDENTWNLLRGETAYFVFDVIVYEGIESAGIFFSLQSASDGETVTGVKKGVARRALRAGESLKIKLQVDLSVLRPGTYLPAISFANYDCSVIYDAVDSNVDLPALFIRSVVETDNERIGYFDLSASVEDVVVSDPSPVAANPAP